MQKYEKIETLPSGGALPGIPGDHAPGTYFVNYLERSIITLDEYNASLVPVEVPVKKLKTLVGTPTTL